MNGVDYAKSFAKEREKFNDSLSQNRKAHETEKNHLEQTNDKSRAKQKETHSKQRDEMSDRYEKNLSISQEKTKQALDNKQKNYLKNLQSERKDFEKRRADIQEDFDTKINNIKDEYNRNVKQETQTNKTIRDHHKENYDKKVGDVRNESEKTIGKYEATANEKIRGNEISNKDEKKKLIRDHALKVQDELATHSRERADLSKRFGDETDLLRRSHDFDVERVKDNSQSNLETFKDKHDRMFSENINQTQKVLKNVTDKSIEQKKENSRTMSKMERSHQEHLGDVNFSKQKEQDIHKDFFEATQNKLRESDREQYLVKQKRYQNEIDGLRTDFSKKTDIATETFQRDLKNQKTKSAHAAELAGENFSLDSLKIRDKGSDLRDKQQAYLEEKNRTETAALTGTLEDQTHTFKTRELALKGLLDRTTNTLNDQNEEKIRSFQTEASKDKQEFAKRLRQESNEQRQSMQRDYANKFGSQKIEIEKNMERLKHENHMLSEQAGDRIHTISQQADKEMNRMREEHYEQRQGDLIATKQLLDLRETKYLENLERLHHEYQRKMDYQNRLSERKNENLTKMYEGKLETLNNTFDKTVKEMKIKNQTDREAYISQSNSEKGRLIDQYENQIQNLKLAQQEQIDAMRGFKELENNQRNKG